MSAYDFKYFPYLIKDCVDRTRVLYDVTDTYAPYYEFGTYLEMLKKCEVKDNNQELKYPLIWLVWSSENTKKHINKIIYSISIQVFICNLTKKDYTTAQRHVNNLQAVLYPILDLFNNQIMCHENINVLDNFTFDVTEHPFWLRNGEGATFDTLSALEIKYNNLLIQQD